MALTQQFPAGFDLTAAVLNASSIPVVTSTADIVSPFTGQIIWHQSESVLYVYTGSAWVALQYPTASSAPGDSGTTTSTSYTGTRSGTANVAGTAFLAPRTGAVRIDWACGLSVSAATFVLMSIEVRTGGTIGSGTVVLGSSDAYCLQVYNLPNETKNSDFYVLSGLTPGSTYNVRGMYRVGGVATGTYNRPKVLVASTV